VKRADSNAAKVLIYSTPQLTMHNLAALDLSPDGSAYLIGGSFTYTDPSNQQQVTYSGLVSIPSNISMANILGELPPFGRIKFLKRYTLPGGGFRPTGKITSDGVYWVALLTSGSVGFAANPPVVFYRGRMDKSETDPGAVVDSARAETTSGPTIGDYHLSNVALSPDNNHAVAVLTNQISTLTDDGYIFLDWNLGKFGGPALTVRGPLQLTTGLTNSEDSLFGLTVKVLDGTFAEVAIMDKNSGNLEFKKWRYNGSGGVLLEDVDYTVSRGISTIPSDEYFFAGENRGSYLENRGDNIMLGMAGDMSFNRAGDSVVFITHPFNDHNSVLERTQKTHIYVYNGSTAKEIYNDPNAQELQPIFTYDIAYIPHYPHAVWQGGSSGNYGSIDTGKTKDITFTVTNDSVPLLKIDSVKILGPNASEFSLHDATVPSTLSTNGTLSLPVLFAPVAPNGARNAILHVYYQSKGVTQDLTQALIGTAHVPPQVGVKEDPALAASIEVQPNPFAASTSIRLTAPEAGTLGLIVHDALGRVVFTSDARKVQAGSIETFEFDAKSLGLTNGVYYVTAILGDRQASRQVVFVK